MTGAASPAVAQSFLTVQVGGERLAFPASEIAEVIRPPAMTRVPLGPPSLLGLANLRGTVIPVVSLHSLLGSRQEPSSDARVVVIDRGAPVGLMIDKIASLGMAAVEGANDDSDESVPPARLIDMDALLAKDFARFTRKEQHRTGSVLRELRSETGADRDEVALVCFAVGGQDFALPLTSVHEIVGLSEDVAVVPQADAVMVGMMTLRGQVLPLVLLRGLLGLRAGRQEGRPRVVVVRIGAGLVGLVIDSMREILRVPSKDIGPVPTILTRGGAEAKIQGIFRFEGGQRLISVLSVDHLFRDQALSEQISLPMETRHEMHTAEESSHGNEQFIVFQLGGEDYGLPIECVDEVVRVPETLTRLPKAPAFIEGVMNLRGRVIPVIDQRQRFRFEGRGERRRERIVVVRTEDMEAGFVVDAVSEVLKVSHDQLRPTPDLAGSGSQVIDRIANIEVEGRMVLLLNPRELLDRAEKDLLAAMGESKLERPSS